MSFLLADNLDVFTHFIPIINTGIIFVGAIIGLWKLKDTLDEFKEDLRDLKKFSYHLDRRLTVMETRCNIRYGNGHDEESDK